MTDIGPRCECGHLGDEHDEPLEPWSEVRHCRVVLHVNYGVYVEGRATLLLCPCRAFRPGGTPS